MSGYDELNKFLLKSEAVEPFPPQPTMLETIPAEQFEDPLFPVPLVGMDFNPDDLPGMMDFLEQPEPVDMSTPSGADQLSLHVYLLTLAFKTVLARLDAAESELREWKDERGYR